MNKYDSCYAYDFSEIRQKTKSSEKASMKTCICSEIRQVWCFLNSEKCPLPTAYFDTLTKKTKVESVQLGRILD